MLSCCVELWSPFLPIQWDITGIKVLFFVRLIIMLFTHTHTHKYIYIYTHTWLSLAFYVNTHPGSDKSLSIKGLNSWKQRQTFQGWKGEFVYWIKCWYGDFYKKKKRQRIWSHIHSGRECQAEVSLDGTKYLNNTSLLKICCISYFLVVKPL